jgi:hypothetical protein
MEPEVCGCQPRVSSMTNQGCQSSFRIAIILEEVTQMVNKKGVS